MKQLTQKLKTGKVTIIETPIPEIQPGEVLVRTVFSCVSAGTESSTVRTARKGYIAKAKERPAQFKQVLDTLKSQGPIQTYRAVMKKLDAHSPLGYSCVGKVIDVSEDVTDISIGDFVACGGGSACHAEIVSVPKNLCVKISPEVDLRQAAYNTVGAIALQGVRQSDVRLGEYCAVIGLGLIGQLTCNILKAAGVGVIGIDIDPNMLKMAKDNCADAVFLGSDSVVEKNVLNFTNGMGCDAVIITAGSSSLGPINFAGAIARKKGTIVIVGAVPTGFDREPYFYNKELSVKMSCSYGPGRYDLNYEEKGMDYPYAYVRWTERRNMQAFQEMIALKRINLAYLTTHVFKIDDAAMIYDMVLERSESYAGILIEYDINKEIEKSRINILQIKERNRSATPLVGIGFIGAGSYAQGALLPNIPKSSEVILKGVVTRSSVGSRSVADRFGFEFCSGNARDILDDKTINTVFIASRHDSHGQYVLDALKAEKNTFVEKPLTIKQDELETIRKFVSEKIKNNEAPLLMVGFNRRFSPLSDVLKGSFKPGPMSMIYRINAGNIPLESWIQDPEIGGGRVLGEVCHFIDYLTYINGSLPVSVYASAMKDPNSLMDIVSANLQYENGSIGSIHYFANGSKTVQKEYIEVYQAGVTGILNDFKEVTIFTKGKPFHKKLIAQNKGQENEVKLFIDAIKNGKPSPIEFKEIYNTSLVAFRIIESIQLGSSLSV